MSIGRFRSGMDRLTQRVGTTQGHRRDLPFLETMETGWYRIWSFFCCWKSRGRPGFQDRVKFTFPHVFTKKCGFQAPKRELAQNFTPTISA